MSLANRALSEQIEQLVREHLEVTRRAVAVAAAVERAFASAPETPRARTRTETSRAKRPASSGRRSRAEMSAVAERLHEAVCAHPGETMSMLAPTLGATSRELERPMKALKRAGRVRSVGQRHLMRYFPTVARAGAVAD
jgi:predicted Zn-dependent protease